MAFKTKIWLTVLVVVGFDALAAIMSRHFQFNYARLVWASLLIYLAAGYWGALRRRFAYGLLLSSLAGFVDSTIGWPVSRMIGPFAPTTIPSLSPLVVALVIVIVTVTAFLFGLIGAGLCAFGQSVPRRMRITVVLSLLALGGAGLLSGYVYLSVGVGRVLKASEFARFSNTILKSFTHPNEGGASRSFSLAKAALSSAPSSGSIDVNGRTYAFPLPHYAVPQKNSQYATSQEQISGRFYFLAFVSDDEIDNYFYRDLPQAGWTHVDQMGAGHFFQGHDAHMTIVQHFYLTSDISEFDVIVDP